MLREIVENNEKKRNKLCFVYCTPIITEKEEADMSKEKT